MKVKYPSLILWSALALGWSADWLFYGKPLGISLLIFSVFILLVLGITSLREDVAPVVENLWFMLPLVFFASMVFVRANPTLMFGNVLAVLVLLAYVAFFYANGRFSALSLPDAVIMPARVAMASTYHASIVVGDGVNTEQFKMNGRHNLLPILRGGLLALPILLVFLYLLTSADWVFNQFVNDFFMLDSWDNLFTWVWRLILIGIVTWLMAGGLAYALAVRKSATSDESLVDAGLDAFRRVITLGFIESSTILVLVNLLFASFVSIQFTYLFGGQQNIGLGEGYTYAEYARRGFFELLAVAILSLALLIGLNWLTSRTSKKQIRFFNFLSTPLIGFVLVMLVSAMRRMGLYEATYGYSELRLYVYVFMAWLGVLLVWFILTLWTRPDYFALGVVLVAMAYLGTLNVLNPDVLIVRQNMAHYRATGKLDAIYLVTLSDDAVPDLVAALAEVRNDPQKVLDPACLYLYGDVERTEAPSDEECQTTMAAILQADLNGRYQTKTLDTSWRSWQSFHLARWRAYRALLPLQGS